MIRGVVAAATVVLLMSTCSPHALSMLERIQQARRASRCLAGDSAPRAAQNAPLANMYGESRYQHDILDASQFGFASQRYYLYPGYWAAVWRDGEYNVQSYSYYQLYAFHHHVYRQKYDRNAAAEYAHTYSYFTPDHSYHMRHTQDYQYLPSYTFKQHFSYFYMHGQEYSSQYSYDQMYQAFKDGGFKHYFNQQFSHTFDNHFNYKQNYSYQHNSSADSNHSQINSFNQNFSHRFNDSRFEQNYSFKTNQSSPAS